MSVDHRQSRPPRRGHGQRANRGAPRHGSMAGGTAVIDLDEAGLAASYELPGGEFTPDEHTVEILAEQLDEFTCGACFLVRHRSQLVKEQDAVKYCQECAG